MIELTKANATVEGRQRGQWARTVDGGMLTKVTETRSQGAISADKRERLH